MTRSVLAPALRLLLRRERVLVGLGLLLPTALGWAWLIANASSMDEMGDMLMPMSAGPWTLRHALLMAGMWVLMMVAMMLPSAAPMVLTFSRIAERRAARGEAVPGTALFAAGYLVLWAGFSVLATALQYALERAALLSPMLESTSVGLAGGVLVAAGLYQWTPLKRACLAGCQSPLDFLFSHWCEGRRGAFSMGLQHGAYCVGCCWVLMLLLFIGGVMNLAWIGGLTLYVLVEKFAPVGGWLTRLSGLVLLSWGLLTLLGLAGR